VSKTENRAYAEKQYSDHFRRFDREQLKSHMLLGNCNTSLYQKTAIPQKEELAIRMRVQKRMRGEETDIFLHWQKLEVKEKYEHVL
jgi:hypothetical protein